MSKRNKPRLLAKLFISTLFISAFTFGGGYVIVSMMKKKFVDTYGWLDESEMLDLAAIAQSAPGAIAVNGAVAVGCKLAGLPGILICAIATVIPPFVIIALLSFCYDAVRENIYVSEVLLGMQAGVAAVISSIVLDMGAGIAKQHKIPPIIIMICAFFACLAGVSAVWIVIACGIVGAVTALIKGGAK